ncbi:DUF5723 family protein [Flavobacterium agrisoli]|uniref:DUF5723 domain-containing protein n=1 Tax=Flavobacterium agrisoli TaxID=2793066 RepID=A0A934PK19_9FLAO|nr:DUF5723 family protein [Flavobacterium agrisoli]MBK0369037.1 hypothetical protein [Flavobacterium agrisoli]
MKKVFYFIICFLALKSHAQNKQVLYNFAGIPQTLLSNPGSDVSYEWYVGIPLLSGISAQAGSNSVSAYDLFAKNNTNFNEKLRNAIFLSSPKDKILVNQQLEVFSAGIKLGDWQSNSYLSFGLYQEFNVLSYIPKDPAILALEGNQNYMGKSFRLNDINFKSDLLSVWHIGYHKKVSNQLLIGGRAKIYSSGFTINSTRNSGYIYTDYDDTTVYNQIISSNLEVQTSNVSQFLEDDYNGKIGIDLAQNTFFKGNLGIGFDLGATYYPKPEWQVTASILDVGFIRHTKDLATYTYKGYYKYEGINPNFIPNDDPDNVIKSFEEAIPRDTLYTKFTTWRSVKWNASAQYSFGKPQSQNCNCTTSENKYQNAIGLQLFAMSMPKNPFLAATAYYQRSLFEALQVKATYTLDTFSKSNIGFGLSANLGALNFYTMVDNVLEYRDVSKANSLSFQLGLNFIIPQKTRYFD